MNSICTRVWTAVTYPQDFSHNGAELGPQTILRLRRLVSARKNAEYGIGSIVLACGIGPDRHEYPRQSISFANMMKKWLVTEGTFRDDMIHCSPNHRVWNCIEVTLEMIRMVKEMGLPKNILIVSTGFHIYPRMWTTWKLLCPRSKGWNLRFAAAWDGTYGVFHELAGTAKYIPMALWHRNKI